MPTEANKQKYHRRSFPTPHHRQRYRHSPKRCQGQLHCETSALAYYAVTFLYCRVGLNCVTRQSRSDASVTRTKPRDSTTEAMMAHAIFKRRHYRFDNITNSAAHAKAYPLGTDEDGGKIPHVLDRRQAAWASVVSSLAEQFERQNSVYVIGKPEFKLTNLPATYTERRFRGSPPQNTIAVMNTFHDYSQAAKTGGSHAHQQCHSSVQPLSAQSLKAAHDSTVRVSIDWYNHAVGFRSVCANRAVRKSAIWDSTNTQSSTSMKTSTKMPSSSTFATILDMNTSTAPT